MVAGVIGSVGGWLGPGPVDASGVAQVHDLPASNLMPVLRPIDAFHNLNGLFFDVKGSQAS